MGVAGLRYQLPDALRGQMAVSHMSVVDVHGAGAAMGSLMLNGIVEKSHGRTGSDVGYPCAPFCALAFATHSVTRIAANRLIDLVFMAQAYHAVDCLPVRVVRVDV